VAFKTHDEIGDYLWSQSVTEDLGLTSKYLPLIFSEKWESIIRGKIKLDAHSHSVFQEKLFILFSKKNYLFCFPRKIIYSVFQEKLFKDLSITQEQYIHYWLAHDNQVNQSVLDLLNSLKIRLLSLCEPRSFACRPYSGYGWLLFQRMLCIL
jgi:hypothetical protein